MAATLRQEWYASEFGQNIDLNGPGIYEWRITGVGLYVGKAAVLRDRINAYPRNVRAMLQGRHWHGDPTKDYRPIHHELRRAHDGFIPVTVSVLENCGANERAERERWWIQKRRAEALAGGLRVLNSS